MGQNIFYPFFQPIGSYFGGVARAILGSGRGKFRTPIQYYYPLNERTILIDLEAGSLMKVAMSVPHLNAIISTGAELFSMANIKHVDKEGIEIENSPVLKFLKKPNPLQSLEQYLYEYYIQNAVYNKTFQYKIKTLSFERLPHTMWLLPSGLMKIKATGNQFHVTTIEQIIEYYEMTGDESIFEVDKVIYMAEGIGIDMLNPMNNISALQMPLSNIVASLKSRNIIVSERGAIGILSPESATDAYGQLPADDKERERLDNKFQQDYHLDSQRGHLTVAKIPMKWTPLTFDIKQLGLLEGTESDFGILCDKFRHDRDIYSSTKGATYENKSAGMKSTVQNGLQPVADKLTSKWTAEFLDPNSGEKLIADYSHLPCMKEDERLAAQGKLYTTQAASLMLADGVISHDQYADLVDVEMDGTGEIIPHVLPASPQPIEPKPKPKNE